MSLRNNDKNYRHDEVIMWYLLTGRTQIPLKVAIERKSAY